MKKLLNRCRRVAFVVGLLAACATLFGFTSSASAAVTAVASPPNPAVVGDTNVPTSLAVHNGNGPNATPTTPILITVVLSCASPTNNPNCSLADADPGVLRPSATGVGRDGSACAGITFTITQLDSSQDKYQFTPQTPFTVGGSAGSCFIDYTVDVLRLPAKNSSPERECSAVFPGGVPDTCASSWQLAYADDGQLAGGNNNEYQVSLPTEQPPADGDADGVPDADDNCQTVFNPDQTDSDGDGQGDACDTPGDPDADNDGVPDSADDCAGTTSGTQVAADGCPDPDGDGVSTEAGDNCPSDANPSQADTDGDGQGDACDSNNAVPTSADQCKKGGWRNYGTLFKNQGDCVSFVATHGKNEPGKNTKK